MSCKLQTHVFPSQTHIFVGEKGSREHWAAPGKHQEAARDAAMTLWVAQNAARQANGGLVSRKHRFSPMPR